MEEYSWVENRVHRCYWKMDNNCAATSMKILAEAAGIKLSPQLLAAATGMHGAGKFGAQCGLIEGPLMFLGVLGWKRGWTHEQTVEACYSYARSFQEHFGSLLCRDLRPSGFKADNPPHLCEKLTVQAVLFALRFIRMQESDEQ